MPIYDQTYGLTNPLQDNYPPPVIALRAPAATDINYIAGRFWVNQTTGLIYCLSAVTAGVAAWALCSPGVTTLNSLTGDAGGAIPPLAGNITLAGGVNITTTGAVNTLTFDLDPAITLVTSVTSPLYTAGAVPLQISAAAGQDVRIQMGDAAGANRVSFRSSTGAEVFSLNSLGTLTMAALTVVGALTQTGGAVNLGMDNLGSAINIGGGNVIKAMTIASGAAAHTLAIGSAAAGAISVDTAAGISLDGATASNFTVTGAGQDLSLITTGGSININATESAANAIIINASGAASSLNVDAGTAGITVDTTGAFSIDGAAASNITVTSAGLDLSLQGVGCAVNMTSTQNENDAIVIEASDAVGGVQIRAGSGGILIGNEADTSAITLGLIAPTVTRNINIGSGTVVTAAVTDTINVGIGGATTNVNSIKTVNINTGGVTLGQVLTNIATGAVTSGTHTTEIATGARAAGTMALNIMTGTGVKTLNAGNADGLTTIDVRGPLAVNGVAGAVTIDTAGVVELNSSGAAIGIGSDANNFAVNVGTAGIRTVTIGSTTGASALVLQSGSTDIVLTGTVKQVTSEFMYASGDQITFQSNPVLQSALTTGVAPTGAAGDVNIMMCQEGISMEQFIIGTQTIIAPRMSGNGLLVSLDLTVAEGAEYNFGAGRLNSRHAYTIGTSPAFFFELRFRINDMDGAAPYIFGFRKVEANNADNTAYSDYATMGMIAASSATQIVLSTELNGGGNTITNTTDNWGGDGTINTLTVLVSALGVVTYLVNGVPPTATAAFTFDTPDVVVPFLHLVHSASPTQVDLVRMKIGYQA